jgi:hypothetical protein
MTAFFTCWAFTNQGLRCGNRRGCPTAARDGTEAEINAFDVGRPDEDFPVGARRGQGRSFLTCDLDGDVTVRAAGGVRHVEAGADDGAHQREQAAQHAVGVERGYGLELLLDARDDRLGGGAAASRRPGMLAEHDAEQRGDWRRFRVVLKGCNLTGSGDRGRLAAITAEGAAGRPAPVDAGATTSALKRSFSVSRAQMAESLFEPAARRFWLAGR